jgi:hypothetical protein
MRSAEKLFTWMAGCDVGIQVKPPLDADWYPGFRILDDLRVYNQTSLTA